MSEVPATHDSSPTGDELQALAWKKFQEGVGLYLVVNAILVVIWLLGGRNGGFWPGWPLGIWGVLVAAGAAKTFTTDYDAEAEEKRRKLEENATGLRRNATGLRRNATGSRRATESSRLDGCLVLRGVPCGRPRFRRRNCLRVGL